MGRDSTEHVVTDDCLKVSIHAPTWGATRCCAKSSASCNGFNPRAHVGRDEWLVNKLTGASDVSIHAPTWGATAGLTKLYTSLGFNPRAHVGRDSGCGAHAPRRLGFNPRAHVGRDPSFSQ